MSGNIYCCLLFYRAFSPFFPPFLFAVLPFFPFVSDLFFSVYLSFTRAHCYQFRSSVVANTPSLIENSYEVRVVVTWVLRT